MSNVSINFIADLGRMYDSVTAVMSGSFYYNVWREFEYIVKESKRKVRNKYMNPNDFT